MEKDARTSSISLTAIARLALLAGLTSVACSTGAPRDEAPSPPAATATTTAKTTARTPAERASEVLSSLRSFGVLADVNGSTPGATLTVSLPTRTKAPTILRRLDRPGASVRITPLDLAEVADAQDDPKTGITVFPEATKSTDVALVTQPGELEEWRILREKGAPTEARWRVQTSGGLALRVREGRVEAVDERGVVLFFSSPMYVLDAHGVRHPVVVSLEHALEDDVLVARFDDEGLEYPLALDPAWSAVAKMGIARAKHTATLLADGTVLVTGGASSGSVAKTSSTEFYDPVANTWTAGPTMSILRAFHTATRLPSGKVLIVGTGMPVDVYDPTTKAITPVAPLPAPRNGHTAVLLASGKVLIAGGESCTAAGTCTLLADATMYDPAKDTWTPTTTSMATARKEHTMTLLGAPSAGFVLVAGGVGTSGSTLNGVELYNPTTDSWSSVAPLVKALSDQAATLVGGTVLVTGGLSGTVAQQTTMLYDVAKDSWKLQKPLAAPRNGHVSFALASGKVLVAGGTVATGELVDPVLNVVTEGGTMGTTQQRPSAEQLADGRVLVSGGNGLSGPPINDVEIFAQAAAGIACTTASDCTSGFCVDGVCCDGACPGNCQACDVAGSVGKCTNVAGAPHGARSCAGHVCVAGACGATCTSAADCDPTHTCAGASCVPKSAEGVKCGGDTDCTKGHCVDGVCCDTACTEQCNACDLTGKLGTCSPVAAAPPHGSRMPCSGTSCAAASFTRATFCNGAGACSKAVVTNCVPFACDAKGCLTSCATASDCADTYVCLGGACVQGAHCSADNLTSTGKDGITKPCSPYLCQADGNCATTCTTSEQCTPGFICDATTKTCAPPPTSDGGSSGGCAIGTSGSRYGEIAVAIAALALMTRKRRRESARRSHS